GIDPLIELERAAQVEPLYDLRDVRAVKILVVGFAHRTADQLARHGVAALQLAFVFQLELAGNRGQGSVNIEDARHRHGLFGFERATLGVRNHILEHRDGQALRDTGTLVDFLVFARGESQLLDDLPDVYRHVRLDGRWPFEPCFLLGDLEALFERRRIVRADLTADAVLEGRDDLASRRVIFRVRGEHQQQIERQAHRIAFDLHVAFLHD